MHKGFVGTLLSPDSGLKPAAVNLQPAVCHSIRFEGLGFWIYASVMRIVTKMTQGLGFRVQGFGFCDVGVRVGCAFVCSGLSHVSGLLGSLVVDVKSVPDDEFSV